MSLEILGLQAKVIKYIVIRNIQLEKGNEAVLSTGLYRFVGDKDPR